MGSHRNGNKNLNISGQIIATSHDRFTPKWWFSKGNPLISGKSRWNIIIWPDILKWCKVDTQTYIPAPSKGWCLNPKELFSGIPYHPFGTPWRVQVWCYGLRFVFCIFDFWTLEFKGTKKLFVFSNKLGRRFCLTHTHTHMWAEWVKILLWAFLQLFLDFKCWETETSSWKHCPYAPHMVYLSTIYNKLKPNVDRYQIYHTWSIWHMCCVSLDLHLTITADMWS